MKSSSVAPRESVRGGGWSAAGRAGGLFGPRFTPVAVWGLALATVAASARIGLAAEDVQSLSAGLHNASQLPLAESERVYLAEIENRGLVLSRKAFPAITSTIRSSDAAALTRFLSPAFRGETLDPAQGRGPESEVLKIRKVSSVVEPKVQPAAAGLETFVRYILGLRNRFATDTKVELALMSLSPVQRTNLAGAWKGSCAFRIAGPRVGGGKGEIMATVLFDLAKIPEVDQVARESGWIQSLRVVTLQEATARHELLAEVAKERGMDPALFQDNWTAPVPQRSIVTGGVYVADVDNDGQSEVLVTDMRGIFLFRGLKEGRFVEVTEKAGLPRGMRGVSNALFADLDNDGLVDLLLDSKVFRNVGGLRFEEITDKVGFRFGNATGLTVGDYDKDGRVDIYVSRFHGPRGARSGTNSWIDGPGGPGNQLWRNLGNWKFEEVAQKANAMAGRRSCFTAAWLDANNDGWPDIYAINEFGGGILLVNQANGTFQEVPLLDDAGDFGSMGMTVGDFDNDGNVDVYTANMYSKAGRRVMENLAPDSYAPEIFAKMKRFVTGSELYRNRGGLKFERLGKTLGVHAVGWAYGPNFLDLDNDGFLDIYASAGFMSVTRDEPDG